VHGDGLCWSDPRDIRVVDAGPSATTMGDSRHRRDRENNQGDTYHETSGSFNLSLVPPHSILDTFVVVSARARFFNDAFFVANEDIDTEVARVKTEGVVCGESSGEINRSFTADRNHLLRVNSTTPRQYTRIYYERVGFLLVVLVCVIVGD